MALLSRRARSRGLRGPRLECGQVEPGCVVSWLCSLHLSGHAWAFSLATAVFQSSGSQGYTINSEVVDSVIYSFIYLFLIEGLT